MAVAACSFGSEAGRSSSAPLADVAVRIKTFLSKLDVPGNLSIGRSKPVVFDHVMTHKQAGTNKCRIPLHPRIVSDPRKMRGRKLMERETPRTMRVSAG